MDNCEMRKVKRGDILDGSVVDIQSDGVHVDIGYKVEGFIPRNEVGGEVEKGQQIKVFVLKVFDDEEKPVLLSKRRADRKMALEMIERAYKSGETVNVKGTKKVKGGILVDFLGVEGFIPYSHLDIEGRKPRISELLGREIGVKVKEFDGRGRKIIMSRKTALEEEIKRAKEVFFSSIKEGDIVKGKVTGITDFGVFVDIGAVEGLIHISEASWKREPDLHKLFRRGEIIEAKVISVNPEEEKVRLSIKQLKPDPWESVGERFEIGDVLEGEVTKVTGFGAFVAVDEDIEGLVHIKDISWDRIENVADVLKKGDRVKVKVLDVNPGMKKLYLGMKQANDPWEGVENEFRRGDVVEGRVSKLNSFGAFVELKKGVEGLVHISNISREHIRDPHEKLKEGDVVKVKVLDVDSANHRIRLSMKEFEKAKKKEKEEKEAQPGTGEAPSVTIGDLYSGIFRGGR